MLDNICGKFSAKNLVIRSDWACLRHLLYHIWKCYENVELFLNNFCFKFLFGIFLHLLDTPLRAGLRFCKNCQTNHQ